MYVSMNVCWYVCESITDVCMYNYTVCKLCTHVMVICVNVYISMQVCMSRYGCMYVYRVCMKVYELCMCIHVCLYLYVCTYVQSVCMPVCVWVCGSDRDTEKSETCLCF